MVGGVSRWGALAGLAAIVVGGPAGAQAVTVPAGTRVRVGTGAGAWTTGALARATAESLWIAPAAGAALAVALTPATRVQRSLGVRSRAAPGALVGLGVGTAVTVGFLSAFCGGDTVCDGDEQVRAALLLGAPAVVLGTVVGALIRTERWQPLRLPIAVGVGGAGPQRPGMTRAR